jgi:glycosyltransferase involved in cell wall biosynthesis
MTDDLDHDKLRILFVGHHDPNGESAGSQLRFEGMLRGLGRVGEIDYLRWRGRSWRCWGPLGDRPALARPTVPARLPLETYVQVASHGVPTRLKPLFRAAWGAWAAIRGPRVLPLSIARAGRPSRHLVRRAIPDPSRYDLIWFFKLESAVACRGLVASGVPSIIDLDDLMYSDTEVGPERLHPERSAPRWVRWRAPLERLVDRMARRSWARWSEWASSTADVVVLANPDELAAAGSTNAVVVPNGHLVPQPRGARTTSEHPVLLFVGVMHYFPNEDGAVHLAREILPILRDRLGTSFEIRIVGHHGRTVAALDEIECITVTGYVADLETELDRADLVVVPLRHGSGTRLKILEAFAHEIPVVSTTIGASGLGATDGVHLLIADDPATFADACVRALRDAELRRSLTSNGFDLLQTRFDWDVIATTISNLAVTTSRRAADSRR